MKRFLYLFHRWFGMALAGFMLIWFASGLLMLYSGPSSVSHEQALAHGEPLKPEANWLSAGTAWARGGPAGILANQLASARLLRQGGEPVWLFQDQHGQRYTLSARDGSPHPSDRNRALAIAARWCGTPVWLGSTERDAATAMMNYDSFRPFQRIALSDTAGTELYLSARSGEVVRASTRPDRWLFWGGSYLHFLRPLDALGLGATRKAVLTWGALAACIAVLTGLWLGLSRWRPGWFGGRRYADGRSNPYRAFWPKWHLWLGLVGGVLALTWSFSGFLSNNPWQLFNAGHGMHAHHGPSRYQGGPLPAAALDLPMGKVTAAFADSTSDTPVELAWCHLGERAALLAYDRAGRVHAVLTLPAALLAAQAAPAFDQASLLAAARRANHGIVPGASVWLNDYDHYYYRQRRQAASERPLPVLRVALGDAADTWLYLDPVTGAQVAQFDRSARVFRWLFRGLHTWDIGWLAQRPIWDVWMVAACFIGLALSVSVVVIGWRRLRRKLASGIAKLLPSRYREPVQSQR